MFLIAALREKMKGRRRTHCSERLYLLASRLQDSCESVIYSGTRESGA